MNERNPSFLERNKSTIAAITLIGGAGIAAATIAEHRGQEEPAACAVHVESGFTPWDAASAIDSSKTGQVIQEIKSMNGGIDFDHISVGDDIAFSKVSCAALVKSGKYTVESLAGK